MKAEWMQHLPYAEVIRVAEELGVSRSLAYNVAEDMWIKDPKVFESGNAKKSLSEQIYLWVSSMDETYNTFWADDGKGNGGWKE
jgi:hypothetical protein